MLAEAGLAPETIDELTFAARALHYTESEWFKVRYKREEDAELVTGYNLRKEIVRALLYAFRNNPDLLARVRDITSGTGHAEMIQDLENCRALVSECHAELEKINFDFTLLDRAADAAQNLGKHLGEINAVIGVDKNAREIRDRVYSYLKSIMTEVRECGKYVFSDNENRYRGYISRYRRRMRKSVKPVPAEAVEVTVAA